MKPGYFSDTEPCVKKLVQKRLWRVVQDRAKPFYYISNAGLITAPIHMELTDLGSVPPVARWIVDDAEWVPPFLVHDNLYFRRYALRPLFPYIPGDDNLRDLLAQYVFEDDEITRTQRARENFEIVRVDRAVADYSLSEAIRTYAPKDTIRRLLVYRTVRMFGGLAWMLKRDQREVALKLAWVERNQYV